MEDGVHLRRWKKTELGMIHEVEGRKKQTTNPKPKGER
jgi:hypothetical protein